MNAPTDPEFHIPESMRAWAVDDPTPGGGIWLARVERPVPSPGPTQLLVCTEACGVCRADLHLAEGDLVPHRPLCGPGHETVGRVVRAGAQVTGRELGERVGIAWLAGTCGECPFCLRGAENLCPNSTYTGWDLDADMRPTPSSTLTTPTGFPTTCQQPNWHPCSVPGSSDCAHSSGRSCRPVGSWGSTASAPPCMCSPAPPTPVGSLLDPGAASAGPAYGEPPEPLAALAPGGTLAVAGIHLTTIPPLDYDAHLLQERSLRSVTANTRADGRELFASVARSPVHVQTTQYPLDEADRALEDLATDRVNGAAVPIA